MKNLVLALSFVAFVATGNFAFAQKGGDGPVGIFSNAGEYDQFMRTAKGLAYGENGTPEMKAMIPMLNDMVLNRPVGWTANKYGGQSSSLGMLSNSKVRQELEIVDDQYKELQELNAEIQRKAAERIKEIDLSDSGNMFSQLQKIRGEAIAEMEDLLLPHQKERLKQLRMQSQLRRKTLVEILTSDPVKTDLEITDEQSDELRDEEKKIQEDLEKEIAKLREKAKNRLLSKLKKKQREEVESMLGETFDFGKEDPKSKRNAKSKRGK